MNRKDYVFLRKNLDLGQKGRFLLFHLLQDLFLIGICSTLIMSDSWLKFFSIPIISVIIFRNFSIMHDAVHGALSHHKLLNEFYGVIAGGICFLPFEAWKTSHIEHHYWSGNIEKDPVTALITKYPKFSPTIKFFLNFLWNRWIPILGFLQHIVFWALSFKQFSRSPSLKLSVSLFTPIIIWISIFKALPLVSTLTIILPAIVAYLVLVEAVNLPHHLELPQHVGDKKFPIWEQYKTARSCIYPGWFSHFVVLNFNFHVEHHMFPDVPWYHLRKLHQSLQPLLGQDYNHDNQFGWILKNRRKDIGNILSEPQIPMEIRKVA